MGTYHDSDDNERKILNLMKNAFHRADKLVDKLTYVTAYERERSFLLRV